ncbi:hypothetical protein BD31_I1418 [Candidatus Nitrosopumilus salaria BD31]|uniref:Uncharacterized protein n=1 Tax=Candidatus Nitrosopumilus salarius BD31 TaxID=859350 RepID=I3D5I0_9ARCH|nr:hypothetical protein [Candidatus Nitrosopumilus salaria]EIJ66973.1 hypothetical protein BD31_I1418 [Candidatus Nitrosopumilus salaria BD31]
MNDPLLDDVKALLDKDFGDDRILKQICRACENNEVISNYERNYVRKLAEKHLGKKPEIIPTPSAEEKKVVPDVVIPQITPIQKTQTLQRKPVKISSNSKNTKIMVGIGAAALAIIIAVGVSFNGVSDGISKIDNPNNSVPVSLSIQTDLSSYSKKDLISISGTSNTSGVVNLSIVNQNNKLVWTEQVSLKNNGKYSTLAIAGGSGWESSGTYTIKVDNGVEIKSSTFSFTA